jgi:hypothetical protein
MFYIFGLYIIYIYIYNYDWVHLQLGFFEHLFIEFKTSTSEKLKDKWKNRIKRI